MSTPKPPREIDPKYKTCLQDARFPNQNATKWCFSSYVDFKRCQRLLGEQSECCSQLQKIYKALCPNAWVDKWENQLVEGTFPLDLPEKKKK